MCGICGILDFREQNVNREILREMCSSFVYRGPDDEGTFASPPVGLGHCRLSIIDLSPAGHQPMSNEDGSLSIVFNGETRNRSLSFPCHQPSDQRSHVRPSGHLLAALESDCVPVLV